MSAACGGDDCDDSNPAVNPGASEGPSGDPNCSDTLDNDCDTLVDVSDLGCQAGCVDNDGDGFGDPASAGCPHPHKRDCDDSDPNVYPGHLEVAGNGIDDDCDGQIDEAGCFIATAAFGSELERRITVLLQ